MKLLLLVLAVVACVMLYRWQTQEKPKPVVEATPTPLAITPKPTPKPQTALNSAPRPGGKGSKPQALTNSADVQKELGLQGTSLDRPARK